MPHQQFTDMIVIYVVMTLVSDSAIEIGITKKQISNVMVEMKGKHESHSKIQR